jgi:small-conductance mechanosensitive channel
MEENKQVNQWSGRTPRMIAIYAVTVILIFAIGGGFLYLVLSLSKAERDPVPPIVILVAAVAVVVALASIVNTILGVLLSEASIFHGSGRPIEMTRSLYQSFFLQSQVLLAVLVVGIIVVLLVMKILTPAEGLPIITGATGFALGREFGEKRSVSEEKPVKDAGTKPS